MGRLKRLLFAILLLTHYVAGAALPTSLYPLLDELIADDKKCALTDTNCTATRDVYDKITAQGYCLTDSSKLRNVNGWEACTPTQSTAKETETSPVEVPTVKPNISIEPIELHSSTCSDFSFVAPSSKSNKSGETPITLIYRIDASGKSCQIKCIGGDQDEQAIRMSQCQQLINEKIQQPHLVQEAHTPKNESTAAPTILPQQGLAASSASQPISAVKQFGFWCIGIGVVLFILGSGKPDRRFSSGVRGDSPILQALGFFVAAVGLIFAFVPVELLVGGVMLIGGSAITIALGKAYSRNKEARLLREENELRLASALKIVDEFRDELTTRRRQLIKTKSFGLIDESKWGEEQVMFVRDVIGQRIGLLDTESLAQVLARIADVTSNFDSAADEFDDNMNGIEYERFIANQLSKLGWTTQLTKGSGDQGIDVIAKKDSTKLVIQCKRHRGGVGNGAVQEIIGGRVYARADFAAVVTNSYFSNSAQELAAAAGVFLLHHSDLAKLSGLCRISSTS